MSIGSTRVRQVLLILWAVAFASVIRVVQAPSAWSDAVNVGALWMGGYPFVQTTRLPMARYWLMLPIMVLGVLALSRVEPADSIKIALVLTVLGAGLALLVLKRVRHQQQ